MRILVLGGTGFIGSYLVKDLVETGQDVTVVHRGKSGGHLPDNVKSMIFDRRELSAHGAQLRKLSPDVVIDMIPRTAQETWMLNRALAGSTGRIVTISSIDVYRAYNRLRKKEPGTPDPTPLKENAPLREQLYPYRGSAVDALHTAYEYEKILVERLAQSEPGLPSTILRLPVVYGPRDPQIRVFEYLQKMDHGRKAILLGTQQSKWRLTRGYVADVAHAINLASKDSSKENRIFNIGEGEALTEAEWVTLIGKAAGWKGEIVAVEDESLPEHLSQDYDWRQHLVIDSDTFRKEFDWIEKTDRQQALVETITWQRNNPPESIDQDKFDYDAEDEVIATKSRLAVK
ncbi:MAG: NAD-dependent epimerase/dehydratase family protein [Candidatus Obscuribacterales bacterium]|nr:NAD-dependent epimerase/dehydratase family protein [Candidatus Obscuribacterales bacterium]